MNKRTLITRLRNADPASRLRLADDPNLGRARIDAILASTDPDPLAGTPAAATARPRRSARARFRRAAAVAAAVVAVPGAALAASVAFGPEDVERGLPAGAEILAGSNPDCHQVETGVFDCTLTLPQALVDSQGPTGTPLTWTSLMVNRDDRITGACRTSSEESSMWRCYVGQAAADERLLDPALLGTTIHDRCDTPAANGAPSPLEAAPGSSIVLCGVHGVFGYSVSRQPER
jgi:hypothetical protein